MVTFNFVLTGDRLFVSFSGGTINFGPFSGALAGDRFTPQFSYLCS
ncbi:MAG: hypothetical protein ACFB4I_18235 [Cyanophyceae cyanobacterium]